MPKPYLLDLREPVFGYADEGHSCRAAERQERTLEGSGANWVNAA